MAKYCRICGAALQPGDQFCEECGNSLGKAALTPPTSSGEVNSIESRIPEGTEVHSNEGHEVADEYRQYFGPETTSSLKDRASLLQSGPLYFVLYLALAIPTYILPYFGSNSAFVNGVSTFGGAGAYPLFYWHLTFLYCLICLAWVRGSLIDRSWLLVFPIFAAIFDLVPGFNWIFLVPTVFHILAMILGVSKAVVPEAASSGSSGKLKFGLLGLAFLVILSFYKMANYDAATRNALQQIAKGGPEFPNRLGPTDVQNSVAPNISAQSGSSSLSISLADLNAFDTWTRSSFPCVSGGAAGGLADDTLQVGGWGDTYITLLRFNAPDNRVVRSAQLVLRVKGKDDQYRPTPVTLRVITQDWVGSGDCFLWSNIPSSSVVASMTSPGLPGTTYAIDITQIYNDWATGAKVNRGVLIEPTLTDNNWSNFYSTRAGEALSPKLVLTY